MPNRALGPVLLLLLIHSQCTNDSARHRSTSYTCTRRRRRWDYSNKKKDLERKCGDQIFVPTLSPIRQRGSSQVQLAFVYTQDVPCLVPDFDWVLVVRKKEAHFWSAAHSEVGILSARRFRELVSGHLKNFDSNEDSLQVLSPKATSDLKKRIQTCEL